ncbi:MAG: class I SAM-dependent methyltransferase [Bacteroidales bacterium]|nr:class I SAM-dependent methyltransferase [Bacteroidales bacterium]MCF8386445.1 class I SAM-dependent methyltransferase [Bacteroidales bacterium]
MKQKLQMNEMKECPLCKSKEFSPYLETRDYFFSGEEFNLVQCSACRFVFTNPRPEDDHLEHYYKSEEYLSHKNKLNNLKDFLYKFAKTIGIKNKFGLVKTLSVKNTGKILDYGSATGDLLAYFKKKNWQVAGLELNEEARKKSIEKHQIKVYSEKSELLGQQFDIISLWHVLEHISDLEETMKCLYGCLDKDGILIIAVPNINSWDASFYGKYWAALDTPRHLYHFNKHSFKKLAENFGFRLRNIKPLVFDAYFISLLSEKYKRGFYHYPMAFINGFKSNIKARQNMNYSSLIYILKKL